MPPTSEVPRDRWGRPLIRTVDDPALTPYVRASTLGKALTDDNGLTAWKVRQAVLGLGRRPDLFARAAMVDPDDKGGLAEIAQEASVAAESSRGANMGTAIHAATELLDLGRPLGMVPEVVRDQAAAYQALTRRLEVLAIERFVVNDDLRSAGTFDRVYRLPDGRAVIGDLKTGRKGAAEYASIEWAVQLAVYAGGALYDPSTGARAPLDDVDRDTALIVHVPADGSEPALYVLDIRAGLVAAQLASRVRAARKFAFHAPFNL